MTTKSGALGTTRVPEHRCLNCGVKMDAHSTTDGTDRPAQSGDLTMCMKCGAIMAIADDLTTRPLTNAEIAKIKADPGFMRYLADLKGRIDFINAMNG